MNIESSNTLNDTVIVHKYVSIESASMVQFRRNGLVMTYDGWEADDHLRVEV